VEGLWACEGLWGAVRPWGAFGLMEVCGIPVSSLQTRAIMNVMCGIVSLTYKDENPSMGKEAEALLKRLEYRGYDSTGASFIGDDKRITLRKQVGAPSKVCPLLHIDQCSGQRFIGQVRWATYGSVTDVNSQPHHVRCKIELVGAHNGNISNTDTLKSWLTARGPCGRLRQ